MASDPQSGSGNFQPISRMAGQDSGAPAGDPTTGAGGAPMGPGGDPQQAMMAVTETIRGMEEAITMISSQFPATAPEARRASEAVRALLMRVVSNPGGAEPAAPAGPLG